jgi:hypothetical protein
MAAPNIVTRYTSENDPVSACYYNFGKGGLALDRQNDGSKLSAFSVRCVAE